MTRPRSTLGDAGWAKIAPYCAGKPTNRGRTGVDNRLSIEAVLWIIHTGSPWRDLPPEFGNWNNIYKRHHRWVKSDRFSNLFNALNNPDLEYAMIDGTMIKVHKVQKRGGAYRQAIGKSRGGMTTKIKAMVDALGNLV